jgi:hypothetical protein
MKQLQDYTARASRVSEKELSLTQALKWTESRENARSPVLNEFELRATRSPLDRTLTRTTHGLAEPGSVN